MTELLLVSEITEIETIATGAKIRDINRLKKHYGNGRWRKLKGVARVKFLDGTEKMVELHWYEAHGVGKKEFKVKAILD